MLSAQKEECILEKAYIPEHIIPLMVGISAAEPFLVEDYLFFTKDDWLIFIGYPLEQEFKEGPFQDLLKRTQKKFQPSLTWFIAPSILPLFSASGQPREMDEYYKLDLPHYEVKKGLTQIVQKASLALTIEKAHSLTPEHSALTQEFLEKENLALMVRELYLRLPQYVAHSKSSLVLNARDKTQKLSAFYVVELGAKNFATYVAGCFSRKHYLPHASDLLFFEMINLAKESHKEYIHLGLGVNEGIRRFKKKWGGVPFLPYTFGEFSSRPKGPLSWIQALQGKL